MTECLGAAILHQVLSENLGIPKRKQSAIFSRLSAMNKWGSLKLKSGSTALKMAALFIS
jgi:hypothetical protein